MTCVLAVANETWALAALAGGTLAKFASHEKFMAEVPYRPADRSPSDRDRLGKAVAAAVGAKWLGTIALESEDDGRGVRDPVMDVIRRARPDVIIVPAAVGDERMPLAELVFNAAYCSTIPNYISPSGLEAASVRAPIFLMDSPFARDFQPDSYVDISGQWGVKVRALELCEEAGANANIRHLAETTSRARGVQVQVEFAEAFRFERAWGRLRPYRLLP